MIEIETFRQLALAFPEALEHEHWGRPSFRIRKKIFATLWPAERRAVLKFTVEDQSLFSSYPGHVFYPVTGGWGRQGYTFVDLKKVKKAMLKDALTISYKQVAPKTIVRKFFTD